MASIGNQHQLYIRQVIYVINLSYKEPIFVIIAWSTLESGIDVGQGISVGPGKFGKNNKRRALNKRRAWNIQKKE